MQKIKNIKYLVWLDLEMTGLDEKECHILEVAMIITDMHLNHISSIELVVWQPEHILNEMVPVVKNMHIKNGLLNRVRMSLISVSEVQIMLMNLISRYVPFKCGILTGNSIHTDRRFLHKYMPLIDDYLDYRHLDISSIKILTESWFGGKGKAPKKPSNHTAMFDVKQSIEELRFYRENCFLRSI